MECIFYNEIENKDVVCHLCPHNCRIKIGEHGICNVRKNFDGKLINEYYGWISSIAIDPIEKKPLYHFYPGKNILSIGSFGCNFKCEFCQNWQISQDFKSKHLKTNYLEVSDLIRIMKKEANNIGIAYTYNEPTIFFEYMLNVAKEVHEADYKNVMVSNGYINEGPIEKICDYIDAFNIDLKAFDESFYRKYTKSSLKFVLKSIEIIKKRNKHLEITNLLIPELNDKAEQFEQMVKWIRSQVGKETILHISRYFPRYKMKQSSTKAELLQQFFEIASAYLDYVYIGNINSDNFQNSYCHECKNLLIRRNGFWVNIEGMNNNGRCKQCNTLVIEYL